MRRREFIGLVGLATAWPLAAGAQQTKMPVVGFLGTGSAQFDAFRIDAVRGVLLESGYVEGRNVTFEYRWAENHNERLSTLAIELAEREVSVIVAMGGSASALAAKSGTASIPIVFAIGGDPTKLGLVASFNRPGGNVAGTTFLTNVLVEKRLEILRESVPKIPVVGYLMNPSNGDADADTNHLLAAAEHIGQKILIINARMESGLEAAAVVLDQQRIGALLLAGDAFFLSRREKIIEFAARLRIPAIYPLSEYARAGGLMSYGANLTNGYRVVGAYFVRILKGEKPADLPVQQSAIVELVINLRTAKALGLDLPTALLARADVVIE